jgi:hypothetical protein
MGILEGQTVRSPTGLVPKRHVQPNLQRRGPSGSVQSLNALASLGLRDGGERENQFLRLLRLRVKDRTLLCVSLDGASLGGAKSGHMMRNTRCYSDVTQGYTQETILLMCTGTERAPPFD